MNTNLPFKVQTISLIICMGLVIASIAIPLSVYESVERRVGKMMQDISADDFMVQLLSPALMEQLRKYHGHEIKIFAPKDEVVVDIENSSSTVDYFTSKSMAALQTLPHVEDISWERSYHLCSFYVAKYEDDIRISQVSPGFLEHNSLQIAYGRFLTENDSPSAAVLDPEAARMLFGSPELAIGQEFSTDAAGGKICEKTLTVVGVLSPLNDLDNPITRLLMKRRIYILDYAPLDPVFSSDINSPIFLPVFDIWISPKQGHQREAISETLDYFQQEYGDSIYVQTLTRREYNRYTGGVQARLAYLPFIGNIIGLVTLVALTNLSLIIYFRLRKKQYEIGVKRSLGASRSKILGEQMQGMLSVWAISIGVGLTLSLALTPIAGGMFQARQTSASEPFTVYLGTQTTILVIAIGLLLASIVTLATVRIFLRRSSTELLREKNPLQTNGAKAKLISSIGFAAGILALMVLFGLRDGAIVYFDQILGWSGGEASGAIADWKEITTSFESDTPIANLSSDDYLFLVEHFPNAQFGWMGRKGYVSGIEVVEASASMDTIRPPKMLAGRWFNENEEQRHSSVSVLGYDFASQLATKNGIPLEALVGQKWKSYIIIGIMDEWPLRYGLGYYTDVVYVPIGTNKEKVAYPGGQIPFIASQGVNIQEFVRQVTQVLEPRHPEGTPEFILASNKVRELLDWRLRLYFLLSAFAIVSLLIGSFGIMNLIFIWIVSRWREIGIRRSIGAPRGEIARMILAQTLQITLLASLAGGTIGTAIALVVQQRSGWPLTVYPYWLAIALGVALFSALVFGGIPAWWAASRAPTEMLRME